MFSCVASKNSKLTSNGRYILCPTIDGKVFIWNLLNKQLVGILNDASKLDFILFFFLLSYKFPHFSF